MLTGIAILERELGKNDYERHVLAKRLAAASDDEAADLRSQIRELQSRREATLRLLDDLHAEQAQRKPDAGRAARERPTRG